MNEATSFKKGPWSASESLLDWFTLNWNQEAQVRAKPDPVLTGAFLQDCLCHEKISPRPWTGELV